MAVQGMKKSRLITCILPKGRGSKLLRALIDEKGVYSANLHHARGVGRFARLDKRGIGEQSEKEVVDIAVPIDQADDIFEFAFFEAEINKPHGGVIYMTSLTSSSEFQVPKLESSTLAE